MSDASIVLHTPFDAQELIVLFHGVGASAQSMVPLGQAVAHQALRSVIVSVQAPIPSSLGHGAEWFSVLGVTEANRAERIAQAMPLFIETLKYWQQVFGIGGAETTLIGFSQGAIMSLHASLESSAETVAGRIISLAGRFATEPEFVPKGVRFHLIHGERDTVIPVDYSIQAARSLHRLGAHVSIDLVPGLGHGIDSRVAHIIQGRWAPSTECDLVDAG